jgi:hypothetical protein
MLWGAMCWADGMNTEDLKQLLFLF